MSRIEDRTDGPGYRAAGEIARIAVRRFDLEATLHSGQVFHWNPCEGGGYAGAIGDVPVFVAQPTPDALELTAGAAELARGYFGLDDDMESILESFPEGDAVLARAVAFTPGLRIVHQPAWECLATFITSSLKQVAHIRQISLELRARFGARCGARGREVFAYPAPGALASAGEQALRECGMGYRAKSLHRAAARIAEGEISLEALGGIECEDELREALCQFHGVGEKIANCVMLFGFGRLGCFPVDVWIERILRKHYGAAIGKDAPLRRVREFAGNHFGPYGGYAQQFLFHYARCGDG